MYTPAALYRSIRRIIVQKLHQVRGKRGEILRIVYYNLLDSLELALGQTYRLTPSIHQNFVGEGDIKRMGRLFLVYFVELADLKPEAHVLDVGCGIGRIAAALTDYLSPEGEYWGFDIVKEGVDWCQEKLTPKYVNFHFEQADIYNQYYHPEGKYQAVEYRFPYPDNYFDFVFLTSVFTHMLPDEMEHYLSEISRVLKKEGRCFITYFLLNSESKKNINTGLSSLNFKYQRDGYLAINEEMPEMAIAYEEEDIRTLYQKYQLYIMEPIHYGSWCRRENYLDYQDMILAIKT